MRDSCRIRSDIDAKIRDRIVAGDISFAEAERMRYRASLQRVVAYDFMRALSFPALGEAIPGRFSFLVAAFAMSGAADDSAWPGDIPEPVAETLQWAVTVVPGRDIQPASGRDVRAEFERTVRARLVPNESDDRRRGLVIHTRTVASDVRDGALHPYIGATIAGWADLRADDLDLAENLFVRDAADASSRWLSRREDRSSIESDLIARATACSW